MNLPQVMKSSLVVLVGSFLAASLATRESYADFVTELTVSVNRDNDLYYNYKYTLSNLDTSTLLASALSIAVSPDDNIADIVTPDGWSVFYSPEASDEIVWGADDSLVLLYPGDNLIFSFKSKLPPGVSLYNVYGTDDEFQASSVIRGTVTGPGVSAVPEPSSVVPFGAGFFAMACYAQHRRRRCVC